MSTADGSGGRGEAAPAGWSSAALAGILASGGIFAWELGGRDTEALAGLVGAIVGGFVAGLTVGRYRGLALASVVAAGPLAGLGLLAVSQPPALLVELARAIVVIAAVCQAGAVLVGGAVGIETGRWLGIGPARSAAARSLLVLAAGAVAARWLWVAGTVASR